MSIMNKINYNYYFNKSPILASIGACGLGILAVELVHYVCNKYRLVDKCIKCKVVIGDLNIAKLKKYFWAFTNWFSAEETQIIIFRLIACITLTHILNELKIHTRLLSTTANDLTKMSTDLRGFIASSWKVRESLVYPGTFHVERHV